MPWDLRLLVWFLSVFFVLLVLRALIVIVEAVFPELKTQ
jgi:hypothetical protein